MKTIIFIICIYIAFALMWRTIKHITLNSMYKGFCDDEKKEPKP